MIPRVFLVLYRWQTKPWDQTEWIWNENTCPVSTTRPFGTSWVPRAKAKPCPCRRCKVPWSIKTTDTMTLARLRFRQCHAAFPIIFCFDSATRPRALVHICSCSASHLVVTFSKLSRYSCGRWSRSLDTCASCGIASLWTAIRSIEWIILTIKLKQLIIWRLTYR